MTKTMTPAVSAALALATNPDRNNRGRDDITGWVKLFGERALVAVRPCPGEWARRRSAAPYTLSDLGILDALMGLPAGESVPWKSLTGRERHAVRRARAGAVTHHDHDVVRRAVAPVTVRFALVPASGLRAGLCGAGRFTPFCARGVSLAESPSDRQFAQAAASYWGIGLYTADGADAARVLVEPDPYMRNHHNAAQWWFAEQVYAQLRGREPGPWQRSRPAERGCDR